MVKLPAVRHLAGDSKEWDTFTQDILKLPQSMRAAVRHAVRAGAWKIAVSPLESVRRCAETAHIRMKLQRRRTAKGG
jgi:hypothetical protein